MSLGSGFTKPQQIPGMRIGVEESDVEQLRQKGSLRVRSEFTDLLVRTVAEFDTVDPLRHEESSRTQFVVDLGNGHTLYVLFQQRVTQSLLVLCLVLEIEFGVESDTPLVQQGYVVRPLLRREAFDQSLKDLRRSSQHV